LTAPEPGGQGREAHERDAALQRGRTRTREPAYALCAPQLPELQPELLFTLVAENVRDYAIFLMDPEGIIACWGESARLMKWWTRQQAEGSHLRFLYPAGGAEDGTAESHLRIAAERGEYNGEGHRVRSDGSLFWAYVTLTALRNPDGALVGFSKVTRDFTARRAVEASLRSQGQLADVHGALEEARRQKRLLANISHELRAPLNAMLGYAALLQGEVGGRERQQAHLERLTRSGHHLLDIINDVLHMARVEAGALPVAVSVNRLGPAIQDALADVDAQAIAREVTLTNAVSGGPGDLPYWGVPTRVRQVLVNLLTNAIKFTESGGRVTVSAGTGEDVSGADLAGPGPWVYVRVEDTGRGVPPDRIQMIFEPYVQSDVADQHRGTGLGLSISRQLARAMGGDITVTSEPGVGSTFTLWLPIAPSEPVPR
jgi:PAS domain S-box-containing protein